MGPLLFAQNAQYCTGYSASMLEWRMHLYTCTCSCRKPIDYMEIGAKKLEKKFVNRRYTLENN
jgi:hypothetical protein